MQEEKRGIHKMIKHDPEKQPYRRRILRILSLVVILIASNLLIAWVGDVEYSNWLVSLLVIFLLLFRIIFIFAFLFGLYSYYILKCLDHRRNRSVQKDHPIFATEQPVPDETALITPITIQL